MASRSPEEEGERRDDHPTDPPSISPSTDLKVGGPVKVMGRGRGRERGRGRGRGLPRSPVPPRKVGHQANESPATSPPTDPPATSPHTDPPTLLSPTDPPVISMSTDLQVRESEGMAAAMHGEMTYEEDSMESTGAIPSMSKSETDPPSPSLQSTRPRVLKGTDLPALMTVLGDSAHCAFQLGIQIGVSLELVRSLEQQALKDPVKFLSLVLGEQMKNTSSPLTLKTLVDALYKPPIHNETLAMELQQHFVNDTGPDQPLRTPSGVPMSPAMAAYSEFLDSVYQIAAIPPDPKGGPEPSTMYTNLAVIKKAKVSRADADKFTKATLHGGIDEIMHEKKAIELKDIFKPEEGQAKVDFVLAEGAPGVGKSTMAHELCRRRHEIEATKAFTAVVLLRLREKEVQEAKSVDDLLYHDDPDNELAVANELRLSQGEGLLLVFDGFDEVPAQIRKSCFVAKVISGQCLPKATVLVTSRPSARGDLLSLRKPDKHIEVLGFTTELIEQYASTSFGANTPLLADFLKYVSTNPAIKSMMYVPLNCAIVVEVYQANREEGKPIPQTTTQLYSELTLSRISRHLNEEGGHLPSLPDRLEDLAQEHPEVHHQLLSLAEVAFNGTLKQEVIFEKLPAGCSTLGLMTVSQRLYVRGKSTVNFFHLTIQEFLAAFHISQLPDGEQKDIFERRTDDVVLFSHEKQFSHMDVVWRFVAGLTGFQGIGWELVHSRNNEKDDIMSPFLVESVYEAQEKVSCDSVVGLITSPPSVGTSSTFTSYALGYCIAVSTCSWRVILLDTSDTLEMLLHGLRSQEEVCGSIDSLNLSDIPFEQEVIAHLSNELLQKLSHLELDDCSLGRPELDLLADVVANMTNLTHFSIRQTTIDDVHVYWDSISAKDGDGTSTGDGDSTSNEDGGSTSSEDGDSTSTEDGDIVKLLHTLQILVTSRRLHSLRMEGVPMGHTDIVSLSRLIAPPGGLRELGIGGGGIKRDCVEQLLKTVLSPSSLQTLTVYSIFVDINTTLVLFEPLLVNHNIRKLEIDESQITHTDLPSIAQVLRVNTTLEKLIFHEYAVLTSRRYVSGVSDEVRDLIDAIKVNRSLKELSLDNTDITGSMSLEEVRAIVEALQYNQTLEKLTLWGASDCFLTEELETLDPRVEFIHD